MKKLVLTALIGACAPSWAQTPATNPMPDGSRDMYVGLGILSAPRFEGARETRVTGLPLLQVQWSNGIFVSGMAAGMHLSERPQAEFGPLLTLDGGRDANGSSKSVGDIVTGAGTGGPTFSGGQSGLATVSLNGSALLTRMDTISPRLLAGGFYNHYLGRQLRLTSSLLYGAGNERDGLRAQFDVQALALQVGPGHALSLSAGVVAVNRAHNQAFFGVSAAEAARSGRKSFHPSGGIKDVHASLRWNWSLGRAWMLASAVQASYLTGDAADSPLVERRAQVSASTGLVYRF